MDGEKLLQVLSQLRSGEIEITDAHSQIVLGLIGNVKTEFNNVDLADVNQAKRDVCPDCGDYGWLYNKDGSRDGICPCHY